jgi:polyribonucleotide nucleotidyltransferase
MESKGMFDIKRVEIEWGGRPLILETGKIARQADGAVIATYGDTSVLCTVVADKTLQEDVDFFPLTVHYQERTFAAGKIPGGFFKREGKPSEREILTSRLIDRPIRPLFAEGFLNETQVVCTLLSHDLENDPDIVSIIGASAALVISGLPFAGPIAAARIGYVDGQLVLNPGYDGLKNSLLDLVVAGTREGVLMVESEAQELPENTMLEAVMFGYAQFQPVIQMIETLAAQARKPAWSFPDNRPLEQQLYARVQQYAEKDVRQAYQEKQKQLRYQKLAALEAKVIEALQAEDETFSAKQISHQFQKLKSEIVRGDILTHKRRIDGRGLRDIRPIVAEVGVLPRTHGSALFTRGETQALVVATLGTSQDEQLVDALEGEYRERFMLHYNFPSFSVGEVGRMSSPGRREIGHGKLAWRALRPLLPSKEQFPYAVRVVSEITESNGSSSMATVCGGSLAMMDAGVPLRSPVAGIAMGLIQEKEQFVVLSDILGDEDHLGDMDFKVAGTDKGVTALQMDIKVTSITREIMEIALHQAREGRLHILGEMAKALAVSRTGISHNAPRIELITIKRDKIRDVIGSGGKTIREICEVSGARIEISEDGVVEVAAPNSESITKAIDMIMGIVAEPEVGHIYRGTVVKLMEFGAIVEFLGTRSGLIHISQLSNRRIEKVEDVVKVGDKVYVKLLSLDDRGKTKLSMKGIDQTTGQETETSIPA